MHIIVLGGAGAMGRVTVRTLTAYDDVDQVTIADYNEQRAHEVATALQSSKVQVKQIDVNDPDRLTDLVRGSDAVLSAVEYVYNLPVLKACIQEQVHYADLGGLFHMTRRLMELNDEAETAGITAILGMGGTPGITNLLARAAVDKLDRVDSIKVQLGCSDTTPSTAPLVAPYSIRTILDEFTKPPQVFQDGTWYPQPPLTGQEEIIFPLPVGRATAIYSLHSECASFPVSFRDKGIRHVSFKIAFPNDFLTKLKFLVDIGFGSDEPISVHGVKVSPREVLAKLLEMAPHACHPERSACHPFVPLRAGSESSACHPAERSAYHPESSACHPAERSAYHPESSACHPERSEGSGSTDAQILRCAQDDSAENIEPQDCDVLRIVATGEASGQPVEITNQVVVLPYRRWGIGAGALDTGVPLAIAGRMLANRQITRRGAFGPEMCVPVEPFFQELAHFDMHITETRTAAIS